MRKKILLLMWAAFIFALLLPSCKPGSQTDYRQRLVNTGEPAVHAIHSERLKAIMLQLNSPTFNRMPPEMEDQNQATRYIQDVEQVAQSMAQAAESITAAAPTLDLTGPQEKLFNALALKLKKQAIQLQKSSQDYNVEQINLEMNSIAGTCNACHSAFRIIQ